MAGPPASSEASHPLGSASEGMAPITVFIVDDHDVVRKGLRFYLSAHREISIVGEAGDAQSAVDGVTEHVPDVVLMDLLLPLSPGTDPTDQGGVQATRRVRQISPRTQVVVLTSFSQDELVFSAIKAGALSYLLKDADAETVLHAIHAASRGEAILHPRIAASSDRGVSPRARQSESARIRLTFFSAMFSTTTASTPSPPSAARMRWRRYMGTPSRLTRS